MADKPSRSLIVFGDGHASSISPSHYHLHSFASRASCGFLSLRNPHPNEIEDDREIRELAQLLDAYDFYVSTCEYHGVSDAVVDQKQLSFPTLSKRFMGLRAAIFTDSPSVQSFATNLGFSVLQEIDDTIIAPEVLKLLGLSGGDVLEKFEFDLVFFHVRSMGRSRNADWIDKFVGKIMEIVQPGSSVASRLHFSVVLSYGSDTKSADDCSLTPNFISESDSDLYLLRPRQSYTMKEGKILKDIRHHHPMLVAQWQEGVTRKDMAKEFSFKEFKEHGANLAILADRFLHEVAFKLWKAPKYGA